jgi:hypothetical protein
MLTWGSRSLRGSADRNEGINIDLKTTKASLSSRERGSKHSRNWTRDMVGGRSLHGGVDRNALCNAFSKLFSRSLPSRGAWIETAANCTRSDMRRSLSPRERGSKRLQNLSNAIRGKSLFSQERGQNPGALRPDCRHRGQAKPTVTFATRTTAIFAHVQYRASAWPKYLPTTRLLDGRSVRLLGRERPTRDC